MQKEEGDTLDLLSVSGGVLCEFFEVAFHLILYVRELYPSIVFERRKKYNVPVQMCCHPELNQYILDVLQTIKPLLEKGEVQRVVLVISDQKYVPIERFVFEIGNLEQLSTTCDDSFLLHTEKALRGFLLKINACDALLEPNPPDCTFNILVYTKESSFLQLQEHQKAQVSIAMGNAIESMYFILSLKAFPWVQADGGGVSPKECIMIPLKSAVSGLLKMQLFVEQSVDKKGIKT